MNSPASRQAPVPYLELRAAALAGLLERNPASKVRAVQALAQSWQDGYLPLDSGAALTADAEVPGRPTRPVLVAPQEVKRRSMRTVEGKAALIHALAHIELNAIHLALDAA
jgi:uncharacterized ferritin-like protein (DUF455 family)